MAEIGAPYTLDCGGTQIRFNTRFEFPYEYFMTDVAGLDGNAQRTPIEDAPVKDGGLVFDFYDTARHITLTGQLHPGPGGVQQRNAMEAGFKAVCRALKRMDGTLVYQPTGQPSETYTVRCDVQPTFPGQGVVKDFIVGLVAANPDPT